MQSEPLAKVLLYGASAFCVLKENFLHSEEPTVNAEPANTIEPLRWVNAMFSQSHSGLPIEQALNLIFTAELQKLITSTVDQVIQTFERGGMLGVAQTANGDWVDCEHFLQLGGQKALMFDVVITCSSPPVKQVGTPKQPNKKSGIGAQDKLKSAFVSWHKLEGKSIGNFEPVTISGLSRLANVGVATASKFIDDWFGPRDENNKSIPSKGLEAYNALIARKDTRKLLHNLLVMNGDPVPGESNYGSDPDSYRDDD